jgi:hypothetical protein
MFRKSLEYLHPNVVIRVSKLKKVKVKIKTLLYNEYDREMKAICRCLDIVLK